jgi:hypothetical protein
VMPFGGHFRSGLNLANNLSSRHSCFAVQPKNA